MQTTNHAQRQIIADQTSRDGFVWAFFLAPITFASTVVLICSVMR